MASKFKKKQDVNNYYHVILENYYDHFHLQWKSLSEIQLYVLYNMEAKFIASPFN